MDDIDAMLVSVRADTSGFARDVATLRGSLEDGLGAGADRAGRSIESALLRAVRSGKLGFDDLGKTALSVMDAITAAALKSGIDALAGNGAGRASGGGSGIGLLGALAGVLGGSPGRATGGPVSPGRAYLVGESGPELFVPTSSGSVAASGSGAPRDVRVSINVQAPAADTPAALQRSSRQVARAVKAALAQG